jgi:hypothetical protein
MFKTILKIAVVVSLFSSCGMMKKMAVGTVSHILVDASQEIQTETNLVNFKNGVPGTLKLVESLLYMDPENEKYLSTLTKAYAAYSFIINETDYLEDFFNDRDDSFHKEQAILNYSKSLEYGLRYLKLNGITYQELMQNLSNDNGIVDLLEDNLSDAILDLEAVLFTAQAVSSLANLQRSKLKLAAQVPVGKAMFDWVCSKKPDIHFGTCGLFYGAYNSALPRALGGNPKKGQKIFLDLIKKFPKNWLIRTAYIQFYLVPMMDEDGYKEQKFYLEKALRTHDKDVKWSPNAKKDPVFADASMRIYQTLALERYKIIKKFEKEIF